MQIIAAIVGKPNFNDLTFTIGEGVIYYGRFLTALINFLIIAATLFVIIRAFEELQKRRKSARRGRRRGEERRGRPPQRDPRPARAASGVIGQLQLERRVEALHDLGRRHVEHLLVRREVAPARVALL